MVEGLDSLAIVCKILARNQNALWNPGASACEKQISGGGILRWRLQILFLVAILCIVLLRNRDKFVLWKFLLQGFIKAKNAQRRQGIAQLLKGFHTAWTK